MNRIFFIFLTLLIALPVNASDPYREWTNSFDAILKDHVYLSKSDGIRTTLVDYSAISRMPEWKALVKQLKTIPSPSTLPESRRLAFWINLYNFFTINKVIQKPSIKKLTDLDGFFTNVWNQKAGVVAGENVTLDQIEHEIIRKRFNEPRIHFAVVCAAISCPDLRPEAYRGSNLDEQLGDQLTSFSFNNRKGIFIDHRKKTVFISKIFKWFSSDFKPSVSAWLVDKNILTDEIAASYTIEYFDYNWNLNTYKSKEK